MTDQTPTARQMARHRMIEAAKRYAASDRTDPFAFRRAVAHIDNGLCTVIRGERNKDFDLVPAVTSFYDAQESREIVKVNAGEREVEAERVVYRSVVRP
jgi:hypothetical protein